VLRERGCGQRQRRSCRKEHDDESREQAEGTRGVGFGRVLRFFELPGLFSLRKKRPFHVPDSFRCDNVAVM
jgi:hypothetical protein